MIEVLLHRVLVKPETVEETDEVIKRAVAAGIKVQLDKREEKAVEYGTVVQVGSTAFKDYGGSPEMLKVGDYVTYAKYSGKEIKFKEDRYLILNDEDIVAKITKE